MRHLESSLTFALLAVNCSEPRVPKSAEVAAQCPSVDVLQELHAATFHFENGLTADGRAALARARALSREPADPTTRGLFERLAVVERAVDDDAARARGELEQVRVEFRDWACLPEALHSQFHALLPERF